MEKSIAITSALDQFIKLGVKHWPVGLLTELIMDDEQGDSIIAAVSNVLIEQLGIEETVVAQGNFVTGGVLDSFDFLRLQALLGRSFNIDIASDLISTQNFDSVPTLVHLIRQLMQGGTSDQNPPL